MIRAPSDFMRDTVAALTNPDNLLRVYEAATEQARIAAQTNHPTDVISGWRALARLASDRLQ